MISPWRVAPRVVVGFGNSKSGAEDASASTKLPTCLEEPKLKAVENGDWHRFGKVARMRIRQLPPVRLVGKKTFVL